MSAEETAPFEMTVTNADGLGRTAGLFFPGVTEVHDVSDGYHTFGDLYDHRRALTIALARAITHGANGHGWRSWRGTTVVRSKRHHPEDSPMFEGGYFVVVFELAGAGQVSYHYQLKHWDEFDGVREVDHAPIWDGHTPEDTLSRLTSWYDYHQG